MRVLGLVLLSFFIGGQTHAHDLSLKYSKDMKATHIAVVEKAMNEISSLLPQTFITQLPKKIEVKIAVLSKHKSIPSDICKGDELSPNEHNFIYAKFNHAKNSLTINLPVYIELEKGRENSKAINCQHKNLYDQALATLIHELTHAYDYHNNKVSNQMEYIKRAGFKKGLLRIKNKNKEAMRSADSYELKSIAESFAVNMEYFTMDPEFMCRKPSMFDYFKKLFGTDPFPNRTCEVNNTVMISTPATYLPVSLDASRVYRIDYLLAAPGRDAVSGFGHSMFRIILCAPRHVDPMSKKIIEATPFGPKCLEDKFYHLVVSYRANVEDAKLNYIKGILGGYPSMLYILNFSDVLNEYNNDEMRDVLSYPLKLTSKERADFIARVKEEHWNYRGSYKFITNNCAVESYDLLKASMDSDRLDKKSSLRPIGVLEDLDRLEFLSRKDKEVEVYPANLDNILLSYDKAYGKKLGHDKEKNKKSVLKFINDSSVDFRLRAFRKFKDTAIPLGELNTQLSHLQERMVRASSFSIMEQQILRVSSAKFKKKVADKLTTLDDAYLKKLFTEANVAINRSFSSLSKEGYGIPLVSEMMTPEDLMSKTQLSHALMSKIEIHIREVFTKDVLLLESIKTSIMTFNKESVALRKEFRSKLDQYVIQVLRNLSKEEFTRNILMEASSGNLEALERVRELLGVDLVTKREILDVKLQKMIQGLE